MSIPNPGLPATDRQWHYRVWSLSWPIIISNLSVPLAGIVDTAVVGHLPDPVFIGAVAIGSLIFSTIYWLFGFLRMSTTGFVAQCLGAGDHLELLKTVIRAGFLAIAISILLLALQYPVASLAFFVMEGSAEVERVAGTYVGIRIWGAPAALFNWVVLGYLFGIQRMRAALAVQLVLNVCNIVLDLVFVLVFEWGVPGVAIATVISEYAALGLGVWFMRRGLGNYPVDFAWGSILETRALLRTFVVNFNIMLRSLFALLVFFYFTSVGARFGDVILAGNVVLMHFLNLLSYGMDGFANAVEALGGHAYGKRDIKTFRKAVRVTTLWAFGFSVLFVLVYSVGGEWMITLMTDIEAVRGSALTYLPWLVALPVLAVWSFQLDGIFIGTTHSGEMRDSMLVSLVFYLLGVWVLTPRLQNHGLWLSMLIFMLVRAITLALYYPRIERSISPPTPP